MERATAILESTRDKRLPRPERIQRAEELAEALMEALLKERTRRERREAKELAALLHDPQAKAFIVTATDLLFRTKELKRVGRILLSKLEGGAPPRFAPLALFQLTCHLFPQLATRLLKRKILRELKRALFPDEVKEGSVRFNANYLGEAILSEQEAKRRLELYKKLLADPTSFSLSIKLSSLCSQIQLADEEGTLEALAQPLRELLRTAQTFGKQITLDMEEYSLFSLTVQCFKRVLQEKEFLSVTAGIALQSYLPEAFCVQKELTAWAKERCGNGGSPLYLRLVKGANLAMERVETSLKGLPLPTYEQKVETDANFKRMLEWALKKEHAELLHVGIGSHNLFDLSYALLLCKENGVDSLVQFEMLKGMSPPLQRVLGRFANGVLLYTPHTSEKDLPSACTYLLRRLEENAGEEHFLHDLFALKPGNVAWNHQRTLFLESCAQIDTVSTEQKREKPPRAPSECFFNEPDTDLSLIEKRRLAKETAATWREKRPEIIPLVIGGRQLYDNLQKKPLYQYATAGVAHLDELLTTAKGAEHLWSKQTVEERCALLQQAALLLRAKRQELIGAMMVDAQKVYQEADTEVSEAIDFLNYYCASWQKWAQLKTIEWKPKGTLLVAPPWNFPLAIPLSGIASALLTGNCVLFKPAQEVVLVAWELVKLLYNAGIPKEVLQFVPCPDEPVGSALIGDERINGVILTGSTETARHFLRMRPQLDLLAETGGKNTLIVGSLCDRELACKDIVRSAFGHAGQKCSALSLLILVKELYEDPSFQNALKEAAESLKVGLATDLATTLPPLIRPAEGALLRGLTTLEEGESWLLQPRQDPAHPCLWSPGIKWGVRQGSFTYNTELFGPVLGVMRAENFAHALKLANGTPYGLTAGLHSLDPKEQELWQEEMEAGNLYINRPITGAIVRRQPFGGRKASSFGPGAKVGGPHFLLNLVHPYELAQPLEKAPLPASLLPLFSLLSTWNIPDEERRLFFQSCASYAYHALLFQEPLDPSKVLGERNLLRFLPYRRVHVPLAEGDRAVDVLRVIAALLLCKTSFSLSYGSKWHALSSFAPVLSEHDFMEQLPEGEVRIRLLAPASARLATRAAERGFYVISSPVLGHGRFELLHYLQEQTVSVTTHRYGNLTSF